MDGDFSGAAGNGRAPDGFAVVSCSCEGTRTICGRDLRGVLGRSDGAFPGSSTFGLSDDSESKGDLMAENVFGFTGGDLSELRDDRGEDRSKVFGLTGGGFSGLKVVDRSNVFDSLGLLGRMSLGLTRETAGIDEDELRECFVGVEGCLVSLKADMALLTEPTVA